jgi:hypothetical protein
MSSIGVLSNYCGVVCKPLDRFGQGPVNDGWTCFYPDRPGGRSIEWDSVSLSFECVVWQAWDSLIAIDSKLVPIRVSTAHDARAGRYEILFAVWRGDAILMSAKSVFLEWMCREEWEREVFHETH